MYSRVELELEHVNERLRAERIGAARHRLVSSCARTHSLVRIVVRPIARALVFVGSSLLRYAYAENAARIAAQPAWHVSEIS
ncbi:MAG: hypothetical protein JST60_09105 [Chloroflexi bacterium SZAS-1]|jgi:hypothetical protein|nr:hypothetical protein [Chloroflexi bacterium SZAS-1]